MFQPGEKVKSSIFIVPRRSTAWRGNEAGWITASGWALAGKQLWGDAVVATTDGVFAPEVSRLFPRTSVNSAPDKASLGKLRKWIPEPLITAYKDVSQGLSKPKVWPIEDKK